ncbi:MAG TPA: hypothetical protein VM266_17080 [Solirubrobacteraceae bacterium]|nr:hypothetical protein [Solirubrobacteraceae bacterium]
MDLVLDLLQAAGIGAAIGIRPFLPALLVAALATGNLGVDFDGTAFAFLEQRPFLFAVLVALVVFDLARRRVGDERLEAGPGLIALAVIAVALAALIGGGSLEDRGNPAIIGILAGVAAAALGLYATRPIFERVRGRLDAGAAAVLPLYREAAALLAAALSILFPPLAVVLLGGLAFLAIGGRRRAGEKYAGLRILR